MPFVAFIPEEYRLADTEHDVKRDIDWIEELLARNCWVQNPGRNWENGAHVPNPFTVCIELSIQTLVVIFIFEWSFLPLDRVHDGTHANMPGHNECRSLESIVITLCVLLHINLLVSRALEVIVVIRFPLLSILYSQDCQLGHECNQMDGPEDVHNDFVWSIISFYSELPCLLLQEKNANWWHGNEYEVEGKPSQIDGGVGYYIHHSFLEVCNLFINCAGTH